MTDKKKIQDKRIWKRLGFELAVLRNLMAEIRCDADYWDILPNKMFDDLAISIGKIDHMRDKAEDRMFRMTMCHHCGVFYPYSDKKALEELVKAVRQKVREAADERTVND